MQKRLEALDLNLIMALYWLLNERSVTQAADRLGLSQPATSRALGRLRDIYDDPLLVKSGREMNPTPLADLLLPLVTKAVKELRSVLSMTEGFDPASETGRFRISCKDSVGMRIVAAWERAIRPYAPDMSLDIVNLDASNVRDLVSGNLDMSVMPLGPNIPIPASVDLTQFVIKPIFTDPWVTCMREDHPDINKPLTIQRFAGYDHILVNPDGGLTGKVDDLLAEHGLSRRIVYRSASFLLTLPILLGTDSVLTCSASLVGCGVSGIKVFECPLPMQPLEFSVGWHPNWTTDARHKWVRSRLLPVLAENDPQCLCHLDELLAAE